MALGQFLNDYFRSLVPPRIPQEAYQQLVNYALPGTPQDQVNVTAQLPGFHGPEQAMQRLNAMNSNEAPPPAPMLGEGQSFDQRQQSGAYNQGPKANLLGEAFKMLPPQLAAPFLLKQLEAQSAPEEAYTLGEGQVRYRGNQEIARGGPAKLTPYQQSESTQADYNTLDQGSKDIAGAMNPTDLSLGSISPGLSWQQRMKLFDEEQAKKEQSTPEYKARVAGMEAKSRAEATNVPFDAETIDFMAEQALAGDRSVFTQLGYGGAGQANRAALRNAITTKGGARGLGGRDLAALNAEFSGLQAGERTLGTRTANIEMAANEVQQLAPLALEASNKVNRTQYPVLNDILLAGERQTGDPTVVTLGVATNSLINTYARAISPSGTPTVSDKDHARELLSAAWAKGQYAAAVGQMMKEIEAARKSPGAVRGEFRNAISGNKGGSAMVPDAPSGSGGGGLPQGWSVKVK